jgi:hypothetical protein
MKNEGVHRGEVRALRICGIVRRSTADRPRVDPSAQADIAQSEPRIHSPGWGSHRGWKNAPHVSPDLLASRLRRVRQPHVFAGAEGGLVSPPSNHVAISSSGLRCRLGTRASSAG